MLDCTRALLVTEVAVRYGEAADCREINIFPKYLHFKIIIYVTLLTQHKIPLTHYECVFMRSFTYLKSDLSAWSVSYDKSFYIEWSTESVSLSICFSVCQLWSWGIIIRFVALKCVSLLVWMKSSTAHHHEARNPETVICIVLLVL